MLDYHEHSRQLTLLDEASGDVTEVTVPPKETLQAQRLALVLDIHAAAEREAEAGPEEVDHGDDVQVYVELIKLGGSKGDWQLWSARRE